MYFTYHVSVTEVCRTAETAILNFSAPSSFIAWTTVMNSFKEFTQENWLKSWEEGDHTLWHQNAVDP